MAKTKVYQYELRSPGIGFNPTRHGTLNLKYTAANILKLRDALVAAAEALTEQAVGMIEAEREQELQQLAPPPSLEARHGVRLAKARKMPKFTPIVTRQIKDSISRAQAASSRRVQLPDAVAELNPASTEEERRQPKRRVAIPRPAEESASAESPPEVIAESSANGKVIVSGGFESDDGSLGTPPASIR